MADVAKRYQDELPRIKKNVEKAYAYFKPNYVRYQKFREFVFNTALDPATISLLKTLKKPQIEFNILEAYISRLRGEFAKQEPSIEVMAGDEQPVDTEVINVVQGHLRHIFCEANKDSCEYQVYTDTLSGGFSVMKVWTEYAHEMSFNQVIKMGRAYDPTLCGFDPLARAPHKGDGNFCFEIFPMLKEDFEREYPNISISDISFAREISGFNWSYVNNDLEIVLLCDYYERKHKRTKIVQLADQRVMTMDEYDKFLAEWELSGRIEQPPAIIGKPRMTDVETIERYRFMQNRVLEHVITSFKQLPLIFIDGNSVLIRNGDDNSVLQMCRPYVYHAEGIQKLKNFAGQTLGNELENMIQHKFKVAKESLPLEEDYLAAYRDIQQADILVYNYNNELNPAQPLPIPQEVQRIPIPPEVTNTFMGADALTQTILGNFDMDLGKMPQQQVSGVAVIESVTQSNSAAMPYIVGFLQGLNRVAEIIVDLLPKYFITPRTIPVVKLDGTRDYIKINQPGGVKLNYGNNALNVKIEAGVNFHVQKTKAMAQIIALMQASPLFAQFMNTEGLAVLLDNVEIKGIEQIKELAAAWQEKMRQMQEQQMQQRNPLEQQVEVEKAKIEQKAEQSKIDLEVKAAELAIEKQKADTERMVAISNMGLELDKLTVEHAKTQAQETRAAVDLAIKDADLRQTHAHNRDKLVHEVVKSAREHKVKSTEKKSND
jgi:hypothetical protein